MKKLRLLLLITAFGLSSISFAQKDGSEYTLAELEQLRSSAIASDNNALIDLCDRALIKKFHMVEEERIGGHLHYRILIKQLNRMFEEYYEQQAEVPKNESEKLIEPSLKEEPGEVKSVDDPFANDHKKILNYTTKEFEFLRAKAIKDKNKRLTLFYAQLILIKYDIRKFERKGATKNVEDLKNRIIHKFNVFHEEEKEKIKKQKKHQEQLLKVANCESEEGERPEGKLFSYGGMILTLLDLDNPPPTWESQSVLNTPSYGAGVELNGLYELHKNTKVGGFIRLSLIKTNGPDRGISGSSSTVYEEPADFFVAGGIILEQKLASGFGLHIKGGVEKLLNYRHKIAEPVYGAGFSIYINPKKTPARFSFDFTGYRSNNQTKLVRQMYTQNDMVSYSSTFIVQIGLRVHFYSMKDEK